MRLAGGAQVGALSSDYGRMRGAKRSSGSLQRVERRPASPIHLIDRPGSEGRFLQRANLGARLPRLLRQRIARRRELIKGELIETIDLAASGGRDGMVKEHTGFAVALSAFARRGGDVVHRAPGTVNGTW